MPAPMLQGALAVQTLARTSDGDKPGIKTRPDQRLIKGLRSGGAGRRPGWLYGEGTLGLCRSGADTHRPVPLSAPKATKQPYGRLAVVLKPETGSQIISQQAEGNGPPTIAARHSQWKPSLPDAEIRNPSILHRQTDPPGLDFKIPLGPGWV